MNKLKQIEAFLATIEAGSFTKAAIGKSVTPAMIGRRVDALEQRLGTKLIHRSTRHLAITEEGSVYAKTCKVLLDELNQLESSLSERNFKVSGHLLVSAPASFGRLHVAAHAHSFMEKYPNVEMSFNLSDELIDFANERYDISIRFGDVVDPKCTAVRLARNRRVVCATKKYLDKYGTPTSIDDLADHNCLSFNLRGSLQRQWKFKLKGNIVNVRVKGSFSCNDGDILHHWTLQDLGLQWRSYWEVEQYIKSGKLIPVLEKYELPDYDIMAVYPKSRFVPAKVRMFIEHLKEIYAKQGFSPNSELKLK
ncbi:LysR family transcriptional regulator [Sneathiella chungangensis]|uniref:LysR family transcriptional regulator n=1 Tax=Sneathiella chungangensis TaxID=1418234 RepID=A0A845MIS4_9PROT|nr:LysR family transcriptional regulator [Sneathiella chungangensis]MZR23226.1 LysR family transcriptional regulator [Sneathiella chungangensis]